MADAPRPPMISDVAEVIAVIADPAASNWLKATLAAALERDPFDAERDAIFLSTLLTRRVDALVASPFRTWKPNMTRGPGGIAAGAQTATQKGTSSSRSSWLLPFPPVCSEPACFPRLRNWTSSAMISHP